MVRAPFATTLPVRSSVSTSLPVMCRGGRRRPVVVVDLHQRLVEDQHSGGQRRLVLRLRRLAGAAIQQENQLIAQFLAVTRVDRVDRDLLEPRCRAGIAPVSMPASNRVAAPCRPTPAPVLQTARRRQRGGTGAGGERRSCGGIDDPLRHHDHLARLLALERLADDIERKRSLLDGSLIRVARNRQVAAFLAVDLQG